MCDNPSMDVKQLNLSEHPLTNKVIENSDKSFTLWLEFEHSEPWDNIDNTFANIEVNMLDGRRYVLNIWTFQFLQSVQQYENAEYIIPPDLFVQTLTRECIENTMIDLLKMGNLEEVLNSSVLGQDD
ncbi:hypothetical protein [Psychrobacter sp. I-STPA10]|uniref:hypothetical protein n=1 Tax=Psychrobacter sp. I-STPA10 TaxID=2585769 RepID=UPI001E35E2CD|nr:hypothetical protein [Psychrobacter sp. I-STPA10]